MDKCFVFAVQVTEEILGSFRKSPDRHQVDDLTGCRFHCRILFCKQLQVVQISHYRYFPPCFFPGAYKFFPAVPCPVFPLQFIRCARCSEFSDASYSLHFAGFLRDSSILPVKNLTAWELLFHLFYSNIFIFKTQPKNPCHRAPDAELLYCTEFSVQKIPTRVQ